MADEQIEPLALGREAREVAEKVDALVCEGIGGLMVPLAGGFVVRDVGSLNGTYLNRERIEASGLAGGDEVQIGKYRLVFLTSARTGDEES